ncbi:MAG: hypothetical protein ABL934_03930 [Lysobacteraceae bacterium]
MKRSLVLCLALLCAVSVASAADKLPPDPQDNPLLITAGFLEHHQDLKYRMLGLEAFQKGRYEEALRFFRRASFFADKPSQGMVAEMYWNGQGVPRDPVQAYVWMDLAAERGYRGFLGLREVYWKALSDAERTRAIEEGQAVYARFGDVAAKPRYEHQLRIGKSQMTGSRTGFNHGVQIEIPGPSGSQSIEASKFYDERYWNAKKYWAWQDKLWMKPRIGKIEVGELEDVRPRPAKGPDSRIPETAPDVDAPAPEVPASPPLPGQ